MPVQLIPGAVWYQIKQLAHLTAVRYIKAYRRIRGHVQDICPLILFGRSVINEKFEMMDMEQDSFNPEKKADDSQRDSCRRCGTCCLKGGPAFHIADRELLESGRVRMNDVYTIREGEPIYDNVQQGISAAETDIIKVRGTGKTWACRFLEQSDNSCGIYENRPIECQVMTCWDTSEIEAIYNVDRLTRKDLVSKVEGLWELVEDHHERCSYHVIRTLLQEGNGKLEGDAAAQVFEMIKYDLAIRPMMAEQGKLDPEMIDFLLGRPLIETISLYGLEVVKEGDSFRFAEKRSDKA